MRQFLYQREIEWELTEVETQIVWDLAAIHCSDVEIAHSIGFSLANWLRHKMMYPAIQQMIDKAKAEGAANLRRAQWVAALHGNVTMQMWLGRAYLGQGREETLLQSTVPIQLGDVSPESKQNLLELREAIYREAEVVQVVELTSVNPKEDAISEATN